MSDTGFSGDPMHEGGSQPMAGLKGSLIGPNTQQTLTSTNQDNPRPQGEKNIQQTWNTTTLAPSAGSTGNNDKVEAH